MKLTMKGDYGLRAMLDMAAYYGQGPIESADIARRQYIPEQYLDQILMALRKEGLVKSIRGPKGGHMLAKPPAHITMAQVMEALEGYVPPMECLPNPDFCKLSPRSEEHTSELQSRPHLVCRLLLEKKKKKKKKNMSS